ncbi:MAG TPA: GFA family protein [Kiloniellaceae bacterium]|nr:GFA family protein [Kiloniellaceae bacterium]
MSEASKTTARCLCGAVKITVSGDHKEVGACHCTMCRRWGGGPALAVDVGKDVTIEGQDSIGVYHSSDWAERAFCKSCGSNLFYRLLQTGDHYLYAGLFDDQDDFAMTAQVFIDEKPDYYAFANETKNMTGAEIFAMYAPPAEQP